MKSNALKFITVASKLLGVVAAFNVIPFIPPAVGVMIVLVASTLKDTLITIGDIVDDGLKNNSYKG